MIAFHIDCNTAAFRVEYLKKHLQFLSESGYDTVIWELEDYVRFDAAPGAAGADALTKKEFSRVLDFSRRLGLRNIPLLQTLAHNEYLFHDEKLRSLADDPGEYTLLCPQSEKVRAFLAALIAEYCELFHDAEWFHLGCDEAWNLGRHCPACRDYAAEHGKAALLAQHVNGLGAMVKTFGKRPAIWADMLLIHPEAFDLLDCDPVLFDWRYETFDGCGKVWIWDEKGGRLDSAGQMPPEVRQRFAAQLYPFGEELCRLPEPFYTADYLKAQNFTVVLCPATACYMDTAYAGRHFMHAANTFDMLRHARKALDGCAVTSWTVHLYPYELQRAAQSMPAWQQAHPAGTLADYEVDFERDFFGLPGDGGFWRAAGKLSERAFLNFTGSNGSGKTIHRVADDILLQRIAQAEEQGRLAAQYAELVQVQVTYQAAETEFAALIKKATRHREILELWRNAAASLATRARAVRFLIEPRLDGSVMPDPKRRMKLLQEVRAEKTIAEKYYNKTMRPARAEEILNILYGTLEFALK